MQTFKNLIQQQIKPAAQENRGPEDFPNISSSKDETHFKFHTLVSDNLNGKLYNPLASVRLLRPDDVVITCSLEPASFTLSFSRGEKQNALRRNTVWGDKRGEAGRMSDSTTPKETGN